LVLSFLIVNSDTSKFSKIRGKNRTLVEKNSNCLAVGTILYCSILRNHPVFVPKYDLRYFFQAACAKLFVGMKKGESAKR